MQIVEQLIKIYVCKGQKQCRDQYIAATLRSLNTHIFLQQSAIVDTSSSNYNCKKPFPNSLDVMLKEYLFL